MTAALRRRSSIVVLVVIGAAALLVGIWAVTQSDEDEATTPSGAKSSITVYNTLKLGDGFVRSVYRRAPNGSPRMIGVAVSKRAMETLPTKPRHDASTCFDLNGDDKLDTLTECAGGTERVLWFPPLKGLPFQWMMFNWQPIGHAPPAVFDVPHFDLHYFIQDFEARNLIRTGPCGLLMNCKDFARSQLPVPEKLRPEGFSAPGAAGRMGSHIADTQAPPFTAGPLTQAFAYGTYDAHISFWEPVVSPKWLVDEKPNHSCLTIKWAPEVELSAYYPHAACATYRHLHSDYLMTLEDFEYRKAAAETEPPEWDTPTAKVAPARRGAGRSHGYP
jgi:hypothetical protein